MKFIMLCLFLLLNNALCSADEAIVKIPFHSKGNQIEIEIVNESGKEIENVSVQNIYKPDWISFSKLSELSLIISKNDVCKVNFYFDAEPNAEISCQDSLVFRISGDFTDIYRKIIILVLPPERVELNQNYPNPFNPSTIISYYIPSEIKNNSFADVTLKVFDILGQEVLTLINEKQGPGYYAVNFDAETASRLKGHDISSGIYIYQLSIETPFNEVKHLRKKMMFLK